jgi:adenylate kinase
MRVYDAQTAPLLDYYDGKDILVEVDGMGTVEEVSGRIEAALSGP